METSNHKEANDSPPSDQFADAEPVTAAAADTKDITPVERRGRDHHKRPREEEIIVPTNDVQVVVEPHKEETQDATMTQPPAAKRVKKNTDGAAVDADVTVEVDPAVQQVEIIVEKSDAETETRHDDNDEAKDENNAGKVFSPAVTRSRRTKRRSSNSEREGDDDRDSNMEDAANDNDKENSAASATNDDDNDGNDKEDKPTRRWRVHQMAEDYVDFVGSVMYPATKMGPYGYDPLQREYPMEGISILSFIKSPLRRPSVMEKWSPYEIAVFEGSLLHFGKEFRNVSKQIGTKSTREVIDFYYIWKKTGHYRKWKERFVADHDLMDDIPGSPVRKPKR